MNSVICWGRVYTNPGPYTMTIVNDEDVKLTRYLNYYYEDGTEKHIKFTAYPKSRINFYLETDQKLLTFVSDNDILTATHIEFRD